jgi:hypothetical protein
MLRIEIYRNGAWNVRGEAPFPGTVEQIKAAAPGYAIKHAHRFYLGGALVHEEPAPKIA